MAIAFDRSRQPGVLNSISLVSICLCFADILDTSAFAEKRFRVLNSISMVSIHVYFTDIPGTTVFVEKHTRAARLISLVSIRSYFADILGTTALAEERLRATWCISLDLNYISLQGDQVLALMPERMQERIHASQW